MPRVPVYKPAVVYCGTPLGRETLVSASQSRRSAVATYSLWMSAPPVPTALSTASGGGLAPVGVDVKVEADRGSKKTVVGAFEVSLKCLVSYRLITLQTSYLRPYRDFSLTCL